MGADSQSQAGSRATLNGPIDGLEKDKSLDRWKEEGDGNAEEFEFSISRQTTTGGSDPATQAPDTVLKRERAKRAVTSESWDDDFLFQHEPTTSSNLPRSRPLSRASRPVSPLPSNQKTLALPSSRPRSRNVTPSSPSFGSSSALNNLMNPSLDSLVSSLDWSAQSEQDDPTLTLPLEQSTPRPPPRRSASPRRTLHRPNPSTSTARPSTASSQNTVTSSPKLETHLPRRPPPRPLSYNSPSRIPSNATTARSDTPSLIADSLRSLTSTTTNGDELITATEDDETEDENRGSKGLFEDFKRYSRELLPSPPNSPTISLKPSRSKRWRFGRTKKDVSEPETIERSSSIFGRRTGPREVEDVGTIDRSELERQDHLLRRSGLPLPVRDGQFVVLGRRSRTSAENTPSSGDQSPFRLGAVPRGKHSSSTSTSTSTTTNSSGTSRSRPQRSSLQFLPSSTPTLSSPRSPPTPSTASSWSRYDNKTLQMGNRTTTEADTSEFSGDERFHLPTRLGNLRRRSVIADDPSAPNSPQSPTFPPDLPRPNSPVESILGGDRIGKWNTSQVSFASATSAISSHRKQASTADSIATGYDTTRPEDSVKNRKRKLTKRRPGSEIARSTSQPSVEVEQGTSQRCLLSASSSGISQPVSKSSSLQLPTESQHPRSPSLPFAQESDLETPQRPKYTPRRSSTTPSKSPSNERGQVVEVDSDWLGIVPFPPSPARTSSDTPSLPSPVLRRSTISRSASGGKSHPPITMRTQAEAKAKRNSGGLGQSISNMLSRSTTALSLGGDGGGGGGKRAPSPAPSAKSGKSNRSLMIVRSTSSKEKKRESQEVQAQPMISKSPSLSLPTKKRSSAVISSTKSSVAAPPPRPKRPLSTPSTPTSTVKLTRHAQPSADSNRPKSPTVSSPSFFSRARNLSRSTSGKIDVNGSPPPVPSLPSSSTPRARPVAKSATPKGQLNPSFKMPRTQTASSPEQSRRATPQPVANRSSSKIEKKKDSSLRTRSAQAGHRPSLSLSSLVRSSSPSLRPRAPTSPPSEATTPPLPYERPRTALGTDHPVTAADYFDNSEDGDYEMELVLPRRNSLSDLRIPARITNAQKKIEEDLERVKQFAKGIEDLKELRHEYDQLRRQLVDNPSTLASTAAKSAQGARRVELDYSSWWEQARTLIDLGDGKPQQTQKTSPGTLASRRDRCVSMAVESTRATRPASTTETETEETQLGSRRTSVSRPPSIVYSLSSGGTNRRSLVRMPSASSIETEASVGARQREMLRGVLAPPVKGASLPSRGPPTPRPALSTLVTANPNVEPEPLSPTSPSKRPPFSLQLPSSSPSKSPSVLSVQNPSRRVSRVGVSGIREFLLRLRHRATEELANSVGTLPPPPPLPALTPISSISSGGPPRRSVSDPTSRPVTPSHSRRTTPSSLLQHVAASSSLAPMSDNNARRGSRSSSTATSEDEDWDAELASTQIEPSSSASLRRSRTVSDGTISGMTSMKEGAGGGKEMMILTTDNMPQLLEKVKEVNDKCRTCIDLLKGLTA
ncbi:uncharacterized protein JCM6883_006837 [Sporobolomyces salmoneus]|uniref:uncharacterized protein n=1 Tax=Sporobolomyces salmoneus TaxID=183962 RepID=UPI003170D889